MVGIIFVIIGIVYYVVFVVEGFEFSYDIVVGMMLLIFFGVVMVIMVYVFVVGFMDE